jgi:hypothetical protein
MRQDQENEELMAKVFDRAQSGLRDEVGTAEYERRKRDFIFHMLDWKLDLSKIAGLLDHSESMSPRAATTFVIGFLYHVVPHLNAAGRLLLDEIPDPFETNAQSHSESP